MKTTRNGLDLIREAEGLRLEAYLCPAGVLTCGYGHTGKDVKEGMKIQSHKATEWLMKDVLNIEKQIDSVLKVELNENQYDAIVSFVYNLGIGNFKSSTLLRKINSNPNDPTIANEFKRWVYSGKTVLPGLVTRRQKEADLYFTTCN